MVKDRLLESRDLPALAESLAKDEHHRETTVDFFTKPGTISKVYEDEKGPILVVRGAKALRLDIQYIDNNDRRRNLTAMLEIDALIDKAIKNGFQEIIFNTNSSLLATFCIRRFGFEPSDGELRKIIA